MVSAAAVVVWLQLFGRRRVEQNLQVVAGEPAQKQQQ
jgi:hypothetical protein